MKVKNLFRKLFQKEYTLNRVRDKITVKEGNEVLSLYVDCDAATIIIKLQKANKALLDIKPEADRETRIRAARELAVAMFGEEQAEQLFEFYHNDENCVVTICGMYFSDPVNGLNKKITKAQKKRK